MGPVPYLELFWAGPVKKLTLYHDINLGVLKSFNVGMLAGVLASAIESVGDYYACARLAGHPYNHHHRNHHEHHDDHHDNYYDNHDDDCCSGTFPPHCIIMIAIMMIMIIFIIVIIMIMMLLRRLPIPTASS